MTRSIKRIIRLTFEGQAQEEKELGYMLTYFDLRVRDPGRSRLF